MNCRSKKRSRFMPALVMLLVFGMLLFQAAKSFANNNLNDTIGNQEVAVDSDLLAELSEAELTDLQQIAKQEGIPMEEAIARYGWQDSFSKAVHLIRESFLDRFAGAAITDGGRGAWIAFKEEVPETAVDLVPALPVNVRFIGGKGFSEAEIKQILEQAFHAIAENGDVASAVGGYDVETGVITIEVQPREIPGDAVARERLRARLQPAQPANAAITIQVSIVDELDAEVEATNMRGGGYLEPNVCTAGFTVYRLSDGVKGISTARHCADDYPSLRYYNHNTSSYTNISRLGLGNTSYGDLAWYSRGTYTPIAVFYHNYGATRFVFGEGYPTVGQTLCKFGRKTGYGCEEVYRLNECSSGYCGLTAMKSRITDTGDSGGPWFYGNTAYGIHHGGKTILFIWRSLFTPTYNLRDALGVRVLDY